MTRGAEATGTHASVEALCSVPGKIMLAGEYAVLTGAPSLACTVDRRLTARATPRAAAGASVRSNLWRGVRELAAGDQGRAHGALEEAVAFGLERYGVRGADVVVTSQIDVAHGIGSSSALRLAVLSALKTLATGEALDAAEAWEVARDAYALQLRAQRRASGYDVATQLVGGVVRFARGGDACWPQEARALSDDASRGLAALVHPFVGGRGAPTAAVMGGTLAWLEREALLAELRLASDSLVTAFEAALAEPDDRALVRALARAVARHRGIMDGAPSFPKALVDALRRLPGFDETWSFKTTGAGGEDAVLLVGALQETAEAREALEKLGWRPLKAGFTREGARVERRVLEEEALA